MSNELLSFTSDDGGAVLIEVAEPSGAPVTRGAHPGAAVIEAGESLERVLGKLGPAVKGVVSQFARRGGLA